MKPKETCVSHAVPGAKIFGRRRRRRRRRPPSEIILLLLGRRRPGEKHGKPFRKSRVMTLRNLCFGDVLT